MHEYNARDTSGHKITDIDLSAYVRLLSKAVSSKLIIIDLQSLLHTR